LILLEWVDDGSARVIMIPQREGSQVLLAAVRGAVIGFEVMEGASA
jgi:hypothetical protein